MKVSRQRCLPGGDSLRDKSSTQKVVTHVITKKIGNAKHRCFVFFVRSQSNSERYPANLPSMRRGPSIRQSHDSPEIRSENATARFFRSLKVRKRNLVKSTSPTAENWLQNCVFYSMNNNTSNEDKHDTNCINNKYTNTYTRKLHNL